VASSLETSAPESSGSRRVYLHIGVPKSGTTYLQWVLAENRGRLRSRGYLYPLSHREEMFHAAVDVRGTYDVWGLDRGRTEGTWARVCDRIQQSGMHGIISHEILSPATPAQIAAATQALSGLELHVVLTARDPGRQVSAGWQEGIKNGGHLTFAEFETRVLEGIESGRPSNSFWRGQDVVSILERWGAVTTPDRVHVVTAPPHGGPRRELWDRFAGAMGLDPLAYDPETSKSGNESLGAAQVALLREVNESLDGAIPQPLYAHVVKRLFAQRILRAYPSRRLTSPRSMFPPLLELSQQWATQIERAGYSVHGDLADLTPIESDPDTLHPDDVLVEEKYDIARGAIADLLVELSRRHQGSPDGGQRRTTRLRRFASRALRGLPRH
jgi:hypothetical protein